MEEDKRLGRAKRLMRMRSVSWGEKETHLNEMEMNFQLSIKEETSGVHCSSNWYPFDLNNDKFCRT